MRRRAQNKVVVQRRGPGLISTAARTAVVAGTATAVVKGVSSAMDGPAAQPVPEAAPPAVQDAPVAPAPEAPAAVSHEQRIALLKQLGELHAAGILTAEEFAEQKAKILAS